jgi:predicted  nucleic acid-binding Zn-ribbon protein
MGKIDYEGEQFNDPILRCEGCTKLVHRQWITYYGGCNHCGNRRFKNVRGMTDIEMEQIKSKTYDFGMEKYEIDPDFLAQFEATEVI